MDVKQLREFISFDNANKLKTYMDKLRNTDGMFEAHMQKFPNDLKAFKNFILGTGKFRAQNKINRKKP